MVTAIGRRGQRGNAVRTMVRRRAAAGAGTALLVASLLAGTASAAGTLAPPLPVAPTTAQPLGSQPHVAPQPCAFTPLGAQELRYVFAHHLRLDLQDRPVDTVDPFDPCHSFGVAAHQVTRTDGGATPAIVLQADTTTATPAAPYVPSMRVADTQLSPAVITSPHQAYLFDQGSGYGVIASPDEGEHWEQRNTGLPVVDGAVVVRALAFAPSNPQVGYTAALGSSQTSLSQTTALFTTGDGGQSWLPLPSQAVLITTIAVDPGNARHLFLVDAGNSVANGTSHVWESSDGGISWSALLLPQNAGSPAWLLVTHPEGSSGDVRIYLDMVDDASAGGQVLWQSRDDGGTWLRLPVPVFNDADGDAPALVADPGNPNAMVFATPDAEQQSADGAGLHSSEAVVLASSLDGFTTLHARTTFSPPDAWRGVNRDAMAHLRVMADQRHDFFLQVIAGSRTHGYLDKLFAFRIAATARSFPLSPPVPAPPPPNVSGYGEPMVSELRDCPLQVPRLYPQLNANHEAGSITFDGEFLDYTYDGTTPNLVYRTDPVTCQAGPPLTVTIPPDWQGNAQQLKQLTYDARYVFPAGDQGAILAAGRPSDATAQPSPTGLTPVYAIDPLTGYTELAFYLPPEMLASDCCGSGGWDQAFAYDVFTDTLWVSAQNEIDRVTIPQARGAVATTVSSCMSDHYTFGQVGDIAAMVVGANGILYAQMEDDATILRADDRTCTRLDGFQHAKFSEPGGEDEQMACDPITFGDISGASPHGTSVIWVRDAVSYEARAYAVANGYCPFPSRLSLHPLPASTVGAAVPLCAVLRRSSASGPPITGATLTFSVDGHPAGSARTDAAGGACVTAPAPGPAGAHTVVATFGGTTVFLPSQARGPLRTYALGSASPPQRSASLLPPPAATTTSETVPEPQPGPQPVPQVDGQIQAQAQIQSQVQSQSQTQVQPSVSLQRRSQTQTAAQLAGHGRATQYSAIALRRASPRPVPLALAGALLLGMAALARRPAVAVARRR